MDNMGLYLGTFIMLFFAGTLIASVIKITNLKRFMEKRDQHYMQRLSKIENLITTDLRSILELLRK